MSRHHHAHLMHFVACLQMLLTSAAWSAEPGDAETASRLATPDVELKVWPGETVGDFGTFTPERIRDPDDAPTRDAIWITRVTEPKLAVFRPESAENTGAACIICPGGGYWNLAWDKEGTEVAEWLNQRGITGIVLKYRVPRRPGQPEPLPAPLPLLDAQRAIRLVRHHAPDWKIDPARIGIIGFSAGGHLAVSAGTEFENPSYERIDEVDDLSCRPDFVVAVYPGYLVKEEEDPEPLLAPWIRIPQDPPPMFFVHAADDPESDPVHSTVMTLELLLNRNVPVELHLYPHGGHGFGVRPTDEPVSQWPEHCHDWLKRMKFVE